MTDFFAGLPLFHSQVKGIARNAAFQLSKLNVAIVGAAFPTMSFKVFKEELETLQVPYLSYNMNNPSFKIQSFMDGTFVEAVESNKIVVLRECHNAFGPNDPRARQLAHMLEFNHSIITFWESIPTDAMAQMVLSRINVLIKGPATEKERTTLEIRATTGRWP